MQHEAAYPLGLDWHLASDPGSAAACRLESGLPCQGEARLATTLLASLLKPVGTADNAPDAGDGVLPAAPASGLTFALALAQASV